METVPLRDVNKSVPGNAGYKKPSHSYQNMTSRPSYPSRSGRDPELIRFQTQEIRQ
jgi:hypothetical protein